MDVALKRAPTEIEALKELSDELVAQEAWDKSTAAKSSYRLSPDAYAVAATLKSTLDEAEYGRKGIYVVSALVISLIEALDEEGPLRKPQP
jgi:hypothetical protein